MGSAVRSSRHYNPEGVASRYAIDTQTQFRRICGFACPESVGTRIAFVPVAPQARSKPVIASNQ